MNYCYIVINNSYKLTVWRKSGAIAIKLGWWNNGRKSIFPHYFQFAAEFTPGKAMKFMSGTVFRLTEHTDQPLAISWNSEQTVPNLNARMFAKRAEACGVRVSELYIRCLTTKCKIAALVFTSRDSALMNFKWVWIKNV